MTEGSDADSQLQAKLDKVVQALMVSIKADDPKASKTIITDTNYALAANPTSPIQHG